jgi:hypothetical protein
MSRNDFQRSVDVAEIDLVPKTSLQREKGTRDRYDPTVESPSFFSSK